MNEWNENELIEAIITAQRHGWTLEKFLLAAKECWIETLHEEIRALEAMR